MDYTKMSNKLIIPNFAKKKTKEIKVLSPPPVSSQPTPIPKPKQSVLPKETARERQIRMAKEIQQKQWEEHMNKMNK